MAYLDYLRTQHWQDTRKRILTKREGKCMICTSDKNIHIHHRRYKDKQGNILFREADYELYTLCGSCHTNWHNVFSTKKKMGIAHIQRIKRLLSMGVSKKMAFKLMEDGELYRKLINLYKDKGYGERTTHQSQDFGNAARFY